ncbi:MAG: nucleoside 2-deoxyribosyltransferase domain-containing protein [Paraclostridium sp.]
MKNNIKVFLGGTCNDSTWRDKLIPLLEDNGINYFNPVVDDWNKEAQLNEIKERSDCGLLFIYNNT